MLALKQPKVYTVKVIMLFLVQEMSQKINKPSILSLKLKVEQLQHFLWIYQSGNLFNSL